MDDVRPSVWRRMLPYLKNKYVIAILFFIVWITFFDRNNFLIQAKYRGQLKALQVEREFLLAEIEKNRHDLDELMGSAENLERYAREKYYMKKPNEDIYVVVEVPQPESGR